MKDSVWKLRRLTIMGMLIAIAYIAVFVTRIPIIPGTTFLTYEPKDALLTIGAFLLDPIAGVIMTIVIAFLEFISFSDTGLIGMVMNIFSSCLFVCSASIIYRRKHTLTGAILGLICAITLATAGMLLWNYLLTPLYMNVPREVVVGMLPTVFLPFNLIKCILNAALTMLLYKSVASALRSAKLLPPIVTQKKIGNFAPMIILSAFIFLGITLALLAWNGVI